MRLRHLFQGSGPPGAAGAADQRPLFVGAQLPHLRRVAHHAEAVLATSRRPEMPRGLGDPWHETAPGVLGPKQMSLKTQGPGPAEACIASQLVLKAQIRRPKQELSELSVLRNGQDDGWLVI